MKNKLKSRISSRLRPFTCAETNIITSNHASDCFNMLFIEDFMSGNPLVNLFRYSNLNLNSVPI